MKPRPSSAPIVGRLYVRDEAEASPSGAPGQWPGGGWRQIGPLTRGMHEPAERERLLIIDVAASDDEAVLSDQTPWAVGEIQFRGWAAPPRRWLEDLPNLEPARLMIEALPPDSSLSTLASVGSLESLRLDTAGSSGQHDLSVLEFIGHLRKLRHLGLRGFRLRGKPAEKFLMLESLKCSLGFREWPSSGTVEDLSWIDVMPELRSLDLSFMEIGGEHFQAFDRAPKLRSLSLSYGEVRVREPGVWKLLATIEELELTRNDLMGVGLQGIGHARALAKLSLEGAEIDEGLMREIASLPTLKHFELKRGTLSGPVGLLSGSELKVFDLQGTEVEGDALADLGQLRSLRTLNLHGLPIDDEALDGVAEFPELEVLVLNGCSEVTLSGQLTERALPALRVLDLCATGIGADELRRIVRLPRLCTLLAVGLGGVEIDATFEFGASLEILMLDRTGVKVEGISAIARCSRLRELSLAGCAILIDALDPLLALKELRVLTAGVQGGVPTWVDELPMLEELTLIASDTTVPDLSALKGGASLTTLYLHRYGLDGTPGRVDVAPPCPSLLVLGLHGCNLKDTTVLQQLGGLHLKRLDLRDSSFTEQELSQLESPALESLKVYQTGVTVEGLLALPDLPHLDELLGLPNNVSLVERQAIYRRFEACWSLVDARLRPR